MERDNIVTKLIYQRKRCKIGVLRKMLTKLIALFGVIISDDVVIGENVKFAHNAIGSIIASGTVLEDNVTIYQNVTLGRANIFEDQYAYITIKKGVVVCAGAKILAKGKMEVGENSIVAANAVLLDSIGAQELWGGVPARFIKMIDKSTGVTR